VIGPDDEVQVGRTGNQNHGCFLLEERAAIMSFVRQME
jgi:hypothetical protein